MIRRLGKWTLTWDPVGMIFKIAAFFIIKDVFGLDYGQMAWLTVAMLCWSVEVKYR